MYFNNIEFSLDVIRNLIVPFKNPIRMQLLFTIYPLEISMLFALQLFNQDLMNMIIVNICVKI